MNVRMISSIINNSSNDLFDRALSKESGGSGQASPQSGPRRPRHSVPACLETLTNDKAINEGQ